MPTTEEILAERSKTHGEYTDHARITQTLKNVTRIEDGWDRLNHVQRESVDMILHKIGRILGNPNVHDHWDDIAGYAKLTSDRIAKAPSMMDQLRPGGIAKPKDFTGFEPR